MKRALVLSLVCLVCLLGLWAAAPAWAFISTGDGAWVWQNPLPQGNDLNGVAFPDATHGWAVGDQGTILATSDGGATWSAQSSGTTAYLTAVAFADASHGWVVGTNSSEGNSVILATSDGGATWTKQSLGTTAYYYLYGVAFADASHGWVVGRNARGTNGIILATSNGGVTLDEAELRNVGYPLRCRLHQRQ